MESALTVQLFFVLGFDSTIARCGSYEIEDVTFVIIDVGGQRNERKKCVQPSRHSEAY